MSYTAVYEYLANVLTNAFTEMCNLHCAEPSVSVLPSRLQHMATDKNAFLNFLIVQRVMLLKVLLIPVTLGENYHILRLNDSINHSLLISAIESDSTSIYN